MTKPRILFFIVFGLYQVLFFVFTWYFDSRREDIRMLTYIRDFSGIFKYITLLGLGLFIVDLFWSWQTTWTFQKKQEKANKEIDKVKAKLYDLRQKEDNEESNADAEPDTP